MSTILNNKTFTRMPYADAIKACKQNQADDPSSTYKVVPLGAMYVIEVIDNETGENLGYL